MKEYLDELEFLATTADIRTEKRFVQRLHKPEGRTYIGSGKLQEVKAWMKEHGTDVVIFDDELTLPSSATWRRTWTNRAGPAAADPDIFAQRARTAHAKTQVELARYEYMLPASPGCGPTWNGSGGTGTRGGAGEKEIETDRRIVRDRIALLKRQLDQIDRQMATQRGNRGKLVRVALVGYTNVGKAP